MHGLNRQASFMQTSYSDVKAMGKVRVPNGMSSSDPDPDPEADADADADDDAHSEGNDAFSESAEREIPKVLSVLSSVLERLVARNEKYSASGSPGAYVSRKLTIFHGLRAPSISIAKYLERIFKYTNCSPSCFVVGYVYIDRLIHRQPDLPITSLNVHRLLVTSVMVATKILDDVHFNNAFFARVGGVSTIELNRLELEFLFRLDFRLQVTMNIFEGYCTHLEKEVMTTGSRVDRSLPTFGMAAGRSRSNSPDAAAAQKKRLAAVLAQQPGLDRTSLASIVLCDSDSSR